MSEPVNSNTGVEGTKSPSTKTHSPIDTPKINSIDSQKLLEMLSSRLTASLPRPASAAT